MSTPASPNIIRSRMVDGLGFTVATSELPVTPGTAEFSAGAANYTKLQEVLYDIEDQGAGTLLVGKRWNAPKDQVHCIATPLHIPSGVSVLPAHWPIDFIPPLGGTGIVCGFQRSAATGSLITIPGGGLAPRFGGPNITNPNCVLHATAGTYGYTGGTIRGIYCAGFGTSLLDSGTTYGIWVDGPTGARIEDNWVAFCGFGMILGGMPSYPPIISSIRRNRLVYCTNGFYMHAGNGAMFESNYVSRFRTKAFDLSGYYCTFVSNVAEFGGDPLSAQNYIDNPWQSVGWVDTDIPVAYNIVSCFGSAFINNGVEILNGTVLQAANNIGTRFTGNMAIEVFSRHDNVASGLDVYCEAYLNNLYCHRETNTYRFAATKLEGAAQAGDHHNVLESGNTGLTGSASRFLESNNAEGGWGA